MRACDGNALSKASVDPPCDRQSLIPLERLNCTAAFRANHSDNGSSIIAALGKRGLYCFGESVLRIIIIVGIAIVV